MDAPVLDCGKKNARSDDIMLEISSSSVVTVFDLAKRMQYGPRFAAMV